MTSYSDDNQASYHQCRHYESCLNSNCSRSPSPIHRQLWEPKHPPSQKLKNNKKLPLKPFDTTKQSTSYPRNRDKSPFLPPPRDLNGASTLKRTRDPLFTYTINNGPFDYAEGTKKIEVKIQKHSDPSIPSSGKKTPERSESNLPPKDLVSARNLKLELELDTSRVPPIVTIKNNTISSQTPQTIQLVASTPLAACTQSCPSSSSPKAWQQSDSYCQCCAHPQPCSPRQTTESCDSICQPCPYLSSPSGNCKEDKATSPTKPCSIPQELESCDSTCQACPRCCPFWTSSNIKEDKAISPINPCSRSTSLGSLENLSPKPIQDRSNYSSDIGSEGTVEISIDEAAKVDIDWEGEVGPINVEFPISRTRNQCSRFEDQVHSYDPQLEAFYTSSYNQSGTPSPSKSRSSSPSPPPSARQNSRSLVPCPPWNSCLHIDNDCFNEAHSASISPSRSPCSPSTICSRSPQSKTLSRKGLSQDNSFGSFGICSEDGEIISSHDYIQCSYSKPENFDCKSGEQQLNSPSSPMLTLTPRTTGNGHMTIKWSDPRSVHEKRYKELDPLFLVGKSPEEDDKDLRPSYYQDEVAKEEKELNPEAIVQVHMHPPSPNSNLKYKTCMQSKELSCISSCKPPCITTPRISSCDPCQGINVCCNDCCCCKEICVAPIEGINKCASLPPHLQSDWSASLRCPPGQVRTKPILYRDSQGHEHIMFADGSIEHLDHHCKPTTLTPPEPPQPSPPPPPFAVPSPSLPLPQPSRCQHTSNAEEAKFDQSSAQNFSPQSGDIVIRARQRLPCMYPGKDNGQVAFFSSDYLDLQEGDSIVRLGKFDDSGRWCSSKLVEMYLRGSHGQWMFLGTTERHPALYPLDADLHQIVRTPNKDLKLKMGDLVISTLPGPNSFYFWNPKMRLDCDHSHLLLRAYIGQPQVVDEIHNLACCVVGHLPVGYVELYVKVKRIWLFLGRDDHMFTEHELMYFS